MKNKIIAVLILLATLTFTACGNNTNKLSEASSARPENSVNSIENSAESSNTESSLNEESLETTSNINMDSLDLPEDVKKAVTNVLDATCNSSDNLLDMTVDYLGDGEINTKPKFYTSETILKGMAKNGNLDILVDSDTLSVNTVEKLSKNEYRIEVINELGDTGGLHFVNINDGWFLDIHNLIGEATLIVPSDVPFTVNGVAVPTEYIISKDSSSTYKFDTVITGAKSLAKYDTGLESGEYEIEFIGGLEDPITLRYELSVDELQPILDELVPFWNNLKQAAIKQDGVAISDMLTDDSKITVDTILTNLGKDSNYGAEAIEFTKRTDSEAQNATNVCYLSGKDRVILNLASEFSVPEWTLGPTTAQSYCWIEVELSDTGLKLNDASSDVWLSDINPLSDLD